MATNDEDTSSAVDRAHIHQLRDLDRRIAEIDAILDGLPLPANDARYSPEAGERREYGRVRQDLATLVWSASNVFGQLQDALNTIWEVQPKPAGVVGAVKRRIVPLSMLLGFGFIL